VDQISTCVKRYTMYMYFLSLCTMLKKYVKIKVLYHTSHRS